MLCHDSIHIFGWFDVLVINIHRGALAIVVRGVVNLRRARRARGGPSSLLASAYDRTPQQTHFLRHGYAHFLAHPRHDFVLGRGCYYLGREGFFNFTEIV